MSFNFIFSCFEGLTKVLYFSRIPPNLKLVVYCTSIREGNFAEWTFAYKRYLETTNVNEKQIILSALGCTTETFLLSK